MNIIRIQNMAVAFVCISLLPISVHASSHFKEESYIESSYQNATGRMVLENVAIDIEEKSDQGTPLLQSASTKVTCFKTLAEYIKPGIKTLSWLSAFGPFLLEAASDLGLEDQIPYSQWVRYATVTAPVILRSMAVALDKYTNQ